MPARFRARCLDCGHEWDRVRYRIACGRVDFQRPETYGCYSCARCLVELCVPRRLSRSAWLRWVSENASELTSSPLHFRACELGVMVDEQALAVISRSPLLFRACERVAGILAGARSPYEPIAIDIEGLGCPECGLELITRDQDTSVLVCPQCESRRGHRIDENDSATVLVDYHPLDRDEVRRMILHLQTLAGHGLDDDHTRKRALFTSASHCPLFDRELDCGTFGAAAT